MLKSPKLPKEGERLTVIGCASEATLNRLLDSCDSEASEDGAQGASDEKMKESGGEQKAEVLSNSSDRNTLLADDYFPPDYFPPELEELEASENSFAGAAGGWEENAEDDEERREVKGRGRVTPKGSAHKDAFQAGSRALSKLHLPASAHFLFFFYQL